MPAPRRKWRSSRDDPACPINGGHAAWVATAGNIALTWDNFKTSFETEYFGSNCTNKLWDEWNESQRGNRSIQTYLNKLTSLRNSVSYNKPSNATLLKMIRSSVTPELRLYMIGKIPAGTSLRGAIEIYKQVSGAYEAANQSIKKNTQTPPKKTESTTTSTANINNSTIL